MAKKAGYSKEKREKFNYRDKYLKHNKGMFGGIYICSQCATLITEEKMEVDHIIPLDSIFGINRVFNCVATCRPCNRSKSTKIGFCTVKGLFFKLIEELYILFEYLITLILRLTRNLVKAVFVSVGEFISKNGIKGFALIALLVTIIIIYIGR